MILDTELAIVRKLPLFANLPPDVLGEVLQGAFPKNYGKGEILFLRNDPSDLFYVVLDGWVKVYRETPDGEEAVFGVFTRGETMAEAAAFGGKGYPANAQVVEDARILPIRSAAFRAMIKENPEVSLNMLASMSMHMHSFVTEIEQLKTRTALQRVSEFLLKLCSIDEGTAVVFLPYDKSLISRRLGMQPESFSRILAKLRKMGIETHQDRVVINDVASLANFCMADREDDIKSA